MYVLWQVILTIVSGIWRGITLVRQCFVNLFFILIVVICVCFWFQNKSTHSVGDRHKGALIFNLHGKIVDQPVNSYDFVGQFSHQLLGCRNEHVKENSLFHVVNIIRQAKNDNNITGMVLDLRHFIGGDQPSLEYIGKALKEFRNCGKPIFALGISYNQGQYYLASFASKIYLSPQGRVDLQGFTVNSMYYKTLLNKLKVSSYIFRVGAYKSAVEPFIRDDMSQKARDASNQVIRELWNNYLQTVAQNRNISTTQIFPGEKKIIEKLEKLHGDSATYALESGLVDALASAAAVEKDLVHIFGWDEHKKNYNGITIYDYKLKDRHDTGNIGVIVVSGSIIDGEQNPERLSCETTALELRMARLDPTIKAIILRVNSPGGSVTASEVIRSELEAIKAEGKPIVVSMGGMAASGGYWISTPASYIIANKNTLTGSIGVFGVIHTIENSLDAIGVHTDGVMTSSLSETTTTKPLSEDAQKMMQLSINHSYDTFLRLVAEARHKTLADIESVAQGRVWMGRDAKLHGLVDALGDFDDAVSKTAELSHIQQPSLKWYRDEPCIWGVFFDQWSDSKQRDLVNRVMQMWLSDPILDFVSDIIKRPGVTAETMHDSQHHYAVCLSCSDIR
ncbi:signal peptide peptidase SppA [Candidatus Erwinia haradaeae]|uniref:Protease 4 n=1 Tax=Candidatus Erwinia haradaeae TaxID=1922217 RepID=A0A451D951_9GAMM|nr:signal peptide peptidase SppA [Candidatus Erwinia haradaeae]VFP82773.1 Protease 4 [Candidatus Erwinia haradaeae]